MTPLIDVVFILLLFFMLASSFDRWRVIPLQLGSEQNGSALQEVRLSARLRADGSITVAGRPTTAQELAGRVADSVDGATHPQIELTTDPDVKLQTLTDLLDRLNTLGVTRIALAQQ